MTNDLKANAVRANLDMVKALLENAVTILGEATEYGNAGESLNMVLGTVSGLEERLESAQKLLSATFILNRAC